MKELSLSEFSAHLNGLAAGMPQVEAGMLEHIGITVENAAKEKIGEYQPQAGPFAAWSPLADSTRDDRERKGFSADEPLLRTGELRDSIEHIVAPPEVEIGSNNDIAVYQELGTATIPPRSFLGGAAFEAAPKLVAEAGVWMTAYLSGTKGAK